MFLFSSQSTAWLVSKSINDVLKMRIQRGTNAFDKYQRHLDSEQKERDYKTEQNAGEFEEVASHLSKIQVQVK